MPDDRARAIAEAVRLAPVRVERSLVRRVTVGLRPFRTDGFVVRADRTGRSLVVCCHGHGGCGITLSWGSAALAVAHVLPHVRRRRARRASVVGAGAVGLAAARLLQREGVEVTLHAAAFPPGTTSDVAGAFWAPFLLVAPERLTSDVAARLADVARRSRREFESLLDDDRYGVRRRPLYLLDDGPPALTPEMAVTPELFRGPSLRPGEHPFGARHALRLDGLAVDPARYLPALLDDFRRDGGTLARRELADASALAALDEAVVVCVGLGARALLGDAALEPVHGQLVHLATQPAVEYMVVAPREGLYMLPRRDAIVLGATHTPGRWSLAPDESETERLLEAHARLFGGA